MSHAIRTDLPGGGWARTVTRLGPTRVNAVLHESANNPFAHEQLQSQIVPADGSNHGSVGSMLYKGNIGRNPDEHQNFLRTVDRMAGVRDLSGGYTSRPAAPQKPAVSVTRTPSQQGGLPQSKEWDAAMASLRTGRRTPVQPRGMSGPIYPTAPKVAPSSGDSYYDNLKSTKDRLSREAIEQREQELFRKANIQQELTPEQLQQQMRGFKTWGESAPAWLRGGLTKVMRGVGAGEFADEAANDTLNNWQRTWEAAKNKGGNALRTMGIAVNPTMWGGSYAARKNRQGVWNANANADELAEARRDVIQGKYQTGLSDASSGLAIANNITTDFLGNLGGEVAAGGAAGKTLGVGAKVVRGATGAAGNVAGNAVTKALNPAMEKMRYMQSGFGRTARNLAAAEGRAGMAPTTAMRQRYASMMTRGGYDDRLMWGAKAGKSFRPGQVSNFEERLGGAVNSAVRLPGEIVAKPMQLGADAVSGFERSMLSAPASVARGTSHALMHPLQTAGRVVRAPGNALRTSRQAVGNFGRNFAMHPWQSTWHGMKSVGKVMFDPKIYGYSQLPGAASDLANGNYGNGSGGVGAAAGRIGGVVPFQFMMKAPAVAQVPMLAHDIRNFGRE